jgi:hypothetical protein
MHGIRRPRIRWQIALLAGIVQKALYSILGQRAGSAVFDFARQFFGKPRYWSKLR